MALTSAALTTLSVFILLTVLSLNQIQVCNASSLSDSSCTTAANCGSGTNLACVNNTCSCESGFKEDNLTCKKFPYGDHCNQSTICEDKLICNGSPSKCLCNVTSEFFWQNGCQPLVKIAVPIQDISVSTSTSITLNWKLLQDYDGVTFFIQTDNGVNIPALSTGGSSGATISNLIPGSKYNFTILSVPPVDNYTTYNNASVAYDGIWTSAVYGNVCKAENNLPECVAGLTCGVSSLSNNLNALCLCNESQFWSSGCIEIVKIAVLIQNILVSTTTTSITLNWKLLQDYDGVTFFIQTDHGVNIPALSTGGSSGATISNLIPGSKYNFTILSVPPVDNYTTYNNASVAYDGIWTSAVYGNVCKAENILPECVAGLTCRVTSLSNNLKALCLCNESQFWSSGCIQIDGIKVSNITYKVTSSSIVLNWKANASYTTVTFEIHDSSGPVNQSATINGGSISSLSPGTKYSFTVVSIPPKDSYTTYSNALVKSENIWTSAIYGQICTENATQPCDTGLTCRNNSSGALKCLCNSSQYWSASCQPLDGIKALFRNSSVTTDTVTLFWNVAATNVTGVGFEIRTATSTVNSSATSTGGSVSGLTPGTKYNFFVVSIPPSDANFHYSEVNATMQDFWTNAIYGQPCTADERPKCDGSFLCNSSSNKCLCNTSSQYWSNGCQDSKGIEALFQKSSVTTDTVTLFWNVVATNVTGVRFEIRTATSTVNSSATSTGGSVSGLTPGTKYNFYVVSIPPSDANFHYSEVNATMQVVWTNAIYGQACTSDEKPKCDGSFLCNSSSNKCLCNTSSQYWSNGCQDSKGIEALFQNSSVTTDTVTLFWNVVATNVTGVRFEIRTATSTVNSSATSTGGSVSGLTPGTMYNFFVVSIPPSDANFHYSEVNATMQVVWTNPAPPGNITEIKEIKNNAYTINFIASPGNVLKYHVTVKAANGNIINESESSNNNIIISGLTPGEIYNYTLYAVNGNNVASESTYVTLKTPEKVSGAVQIDPLANLTSTSVTITWQKPNEPNGNILGYIVELFSNKSLILDYNLTCSNCSHMIPNLKPYRNYTINVAAINGAGKGLSSSVDFQTHIGKPNPVKKLEPNPFRITEGAGLIITITSGEYTGPTHFNVCLSADKVADNCTTVFVKDSDDYHFHSFNGSIPVNATFDNLLAFWNYTVRVLASTGAEDSTWTETKVETLTNTPGFAAATVKQDLNIATLFTIDIQCPPEQERRGKILNYIINISNNSSSFNQTIKTLNECSNNTTETLKDIKVEQSYMIKILVQNNDFNGTFYSLGSYYVFPKAPTRIKNETSIVQKGSDFTTSQAKVTIMLPIILDDTQGKLANASLLVCADVSKSSCYQDRRKRSSVLPGTNITWFQAQKQGFAVQYRTTPDDWLSQLQKATSPNYDYTIGADQCDNRETNYCNGPLPPGTKFSFVVIVCTAGDCSNSITLSLHTNAEENNTPAIVGGVVGGILGLALIIAVVFLIIYFKRRPHSARPSSSSYVDLIKRDENIKEHRPVRITEFKDHVKKLHKDSNLLFQDEFEDIKKLSSRLPNICDEAKKENNRVKNRYVDILPYDSSRVKLEVQPEDDETMDFINANYIPGYNSVREYIATQGPMHSTVPDFWRMVWEQKCRVIVMLSDLTEQGKPKVTLYWPENLGEPINYGNVIVEMTNFSQLNKYIIRNFKIAKGSETRKVTHFFLPGWWDFSANLTTGDVLEFAQLVRQEATPANSGPIIVHCSAGVGRTGTFIALDYFMQYIEKHSLLDSVDVFSYVMKMRAARPRMVQAETQYIFIFDALDEVIDRKIKIEQEKNEHLYSNGGGNDVYANMVKAPEESIYANTQVINEKNGIDNKAFESDYENLTLNKTNQPTTVL
ncbi:receptor-type tyrosine-protein phosphatase eta-like isoform X3 [Biomphalaria glabrata]|uniref:protein-tyrosine-phosphatase n=1 Tax=Biomphalaria glabrata TaxID=6526 RepID=A0A9W3AJP2_BIOGL|nr:receptor-type tyrosine-protein phosphatase eta-like isoform X3 [Biomphalaria glabrata]